MAKVILNQDFFCGYRIRKSPDRHTTVDVPNKYIQYLPKHAIIVSMEEVEDLNEIAQPSKSFMDTMKKFSEEKKVDSRQYLNEFDEDRPALDKMHEYLNEHSKQANELFTSVSIITADAQELIRKHNLDQEMITGSGKNGRVTKSDVLNYMEYKGIN